MTTTQNDRDASYQAFATDYLTPIEPTYSARYVVRDMPDPRYLGDFAIVDTHDNERVLGRDFSYYAACRRAGSLNETAITSGDEPPARFVAINDVSTSSTLPWVVLDWTTGVRRSYFPTRDKAMAVCDRLNEEASA